jgi:hypothetical protein
LLPIQLFALDNAMPDRAHAKDLAWIGDAVLSLFARRWILSHPELEKQLSRQELFSRLTSNQFLASFGEPTSVEAKIGRQYEEEGLDACFAELERAFIPIYRKQLMKKVPGGRRSGA